MSTRYRLAVVTSHPVQYQAPLFQRPVYPDVEPPVPYGDDRSVAGEVDSGLVAGSMGPPLLKGYRSVFLKRVDTVQVRCSDWQPTSESFAISLPDDLMRF